MKIGHWAGTEAMCFLLSSLLILLPACSNQQAVSNAGTVQGLMKDHLPPEHYSLEFEPIPEDELGFPTPEPSPYRLGIGDKLVVQIVASQPVAGYEGGLSATVKQDGTIRLPTLGRVPADGKTTLELEDDLVGPAQQNFVKDSVVNVEVTSFASRRFFVVGEITQPGTLPVNGRMTLLEALISAGGTNKETADLEEAYVIRDHQPIPFSIADLVQRGHPIGQMVMESNDIVYVPHVQDRADYIYVFGEVKTPNRILMDHEGPRGSEGVLTLADAIGISGGLQAERADINSITIFRGTFKSAKKFKISTKDLYESGHQIYLAPGDRIAVGTSDTAEFSDSVGTSLQILSATASALSLALNAVTLADRTSR